MVELKEIEGKQKNLYQQSLKRKKDKDKISFLVYWTEKKYAEKSLLTEQEETWKDSMSYATKKTTETL